LKLLYFELLETQIFVFFVTNTTHYLSRMKEEFSG